MAASHQIMMSVARPFARAVIALMIALLPAVVVAQTRVMIGGLPTPGQTARLRMTQEMDFEFKPVGDTPPPGMPKEGIRSTLKSMLLLKQQVGAVDAAGRLRLDLTYEDVSQELRLNDVALPIPEGSYDAIRGKTVTLWMGAKYEVLDVTAPDNFPIPADQLKQIFGPLVASLPHQEMAIGDAVSLPFSMSLPIPAPAGSAAPTLTGQTKTTLIRVTPEDGDQLATLEQTLEVALDNTNETSAGSRVRMNVRIAGTGTTETFVRGGLIKSNRTEATMSGQFSPAKDGAALKLTGKFIIAVERVPE
jgi:hypothetical protein